MLTKAQELDVLYCKTWFLRTEISSAGPDIDEGNLNGDLVTYDDYVPLADEGPATGMDEFTVMGLIGGNVILLALLSFCGPKANLEFRVAFLPRLGENLEEEK